MKYIVQAVVLPALCFTLCAETAGRVQLTVTNRAGQPIKGASITLERTDITWSKTIVTNDQGLALQVGLAPKDFVVTVKAEGYAGVKASERVPVGESLVKTYVLLTAAEARNEAPAAVAANTDDPLEVKRAEGSTAYYAAMGLYNEQKFAEALPLMETAHKNLTEAAAGLKDEKAKTDLKAWMPALERVYGVVLAEAAKNDPAKAALATEAEPYLLTALAKNPKDQPVILALVAVGKVTQDPERMKKYQAMLDTLIGPRPEVAYNEAVAKHNAGDEAGAKVALDKAIAMDPKYSESYYLLGVVQFSLGNPKAAKDAFRKYLELDPKGKKAGEVKEFLKELGK